MELNYHLGFWDADIAYEIQFDGIGVLWNQHLLDEWITCETENGGMEFYNEIQTYGRMDCLNTP